jgi:dTDP-4-amino-4,6-dideoxygalactose transaminase
MINAASTLADAQGEFETIPFNKAVSLGSEADRIAQALRGQACGNGPFGRRCEQILGELLGCQALVVSSATAALELAALLLEIKPGDEVIIPSFTFVSTANAFLLRGAKLLFADVDASGNLDPREVSRLRSARTRAIVPVHYAGGSCDMDELRSAAEGIAIVEDAAQAIGASFRGVPLGTFGSCGAISFHETKNVGCGEGGALIVRDSSLLERARCLRDKGTDRHRFEQGLCDKYTWVDVGTSPLLAELSAAWLSVQLESLGRIQARREEIWARYLAELEGPAERAGVAVVRGHPKGRGNAHLFALVFRTGDERRRFVAHTRAMGISTPPHYVALHTSPLGRRLHDGQPLPWSERLSSCLARLPLFFNLPDGAVARVIDATLDFLVTL